MKSPRPSRTAGAVALSVLCLSLTGLLVPAALGAPTQDALSEMSAQSGDEEVAEDPATLEPEGLISDDYQQRQQGAASALRAGAQGPFKNVVFDLVNNARQNAGLSPLGASTHLNKIAQDWANAMARTGDFRHNPNYAQQVWAQPGWRGVGENIAAGYADGAQVMKGWMDSEGHRNNILGDYNRIGIGVATSSTGFGIYWVQVFGSHSGSTPADGIYSVSVPRLGGANRYATNYAVNATKMTAAKPVFIATGQDFPDALSIGPAVSLTEGSLVLTTPTGVDAKSLALIKSKGPSDIYLVGGTGAVPDAVGTQLKQATGVTPKRLPGKDRYETSAKIATTFFSARTFDVAFVATGENFPDALSAASAGGALEGPVLLTRGSTDTRLRGDMTTLLRNKGVKNIQLVGGKAVVNASLAANLSSNGFSVGRLEGVNRYQTNLAVNNYITANSGATSLEGVWVATGTDFPDALSAAAPAGSKAQRLVLSNGTCLMKPVVSEWIEGTGSVVQQVSIVGGDAVLRSGVSNLLQCTP